MILLFRLPLVLIRSRFRSRLGPLDESILRLRVLPNDIDVNLHLNNGRYLSVMDLGRMDFIARSGILREAMRRRWFPLVGSAMIRFLRPLDPLQAYELRTRVVCWDEKWFYLEQRFERDGNLFAIGWIQGLFRSRSGNVRPRQVLELTGYSVDSPPMPSAITQWQKSMRANE